MLRSTVASHTFLAGPADWWRTAVVYQVYPRSFADANGDGIGDLKGIISRADYLKNLAVDAVWMSPFYPSELADGGYDVANYRDVDPKIGTLEEFDQLIHEFHERNIRVIVDIVPNHTSDQHPWFQEALAAEPGSPARERYIFRDGRGEHGELPPSDLASHFSPLAWTRVPDGQWYLHLFAKEQPDLNWDLPEIREDFLKTLRFWSDRGVDGFRVDVAHALVKNLDPLPSRSGYTVDLIPEDGTDPLFDRDDLQEIYREWRAVFNEYDPPRIAVAESWVPHSRKFLYASADSLGQVFNFDLVASEWGAEDYQKIVDQNVEFERESGSSSTWVLSNHDIIRHATRLAFPRGLDQSAWYEANRFNPDVDVELGLRRALAGTLHILGLPGSTYIYQGEELGLPEVLDIPDEDMQDPTWERYGHKSKSRDGCRVPIPWTRSGSSFGFGPNGSHLPQPQWFGDYSVEAQEGIPGSALELYREAIALRNTLLGDNSFRWIHTDDSVLHYERNNGWQVITNFGDTPVDMPVGEVLICSAEHDGTMLPGNATAWLRA
jgi:alpha-glucosidase